VRDFHSGKRTIRGKPNPDLRRWEVVTIVLQRRIDDLLGTRTPAERGVDPPASGPRKNRSDHPPRPRQIPLQPTRPRNGPKRCGDGPVIGKLGATRAAPAVAASG
jgi:hypothetical protein